MAQRFPDDFDGILVGAPVLDIPAIQAQIIGARRALASSPLSAEKVEYLAGFVQHKCDAIDGVADGVVDDPRRCKVDFATDTGVRRGRRRLALPHGRGAYVLDVFARDVTSNGVPVYPGVSDRNGHSGSGCVRAGRRDPVLAGSARSAAPVGRGTVCRELRAARQRALAATGGRLISIATCTSCSRSVRGSMRRIRTSVFSARTAASS